jgi:large subunit ribosomal protein L22
MSPAPRKKKDEEAPTAAEVEAKASEEAAESVPKAEEKPKPAAKKKPAAKTKAAPKAAAEEQADDAKAEDDSSDEEKPAKKPAAKKKAAPEAEAKPAAKPARKRDQPRAKRAPDVPAVLVSAKARYVRTSARKARLVCDHIRGKDVEQARAILSFTPRGAAKPWLKLLESAIANAEHNHELVGDELKIASIHADEGPTLKRYRPRAMGRATRIRKRTSHLTITLTPKE